MIKEVEFEKIKGILKDNFKNEIPNDIICNPYNKSLAYFNENCIIGILNYDHIYDRIEINYIVVFPEYRKIGIGSGLIKYLIENNEFTNITLEVREDNISAIKLYEKFNFKNVSIRKNYYGNMNAIMMMRSM